MLRAALLACLLTLAALATATDLTTNPVLQALQEVAFSGTEAKKGPEKSPGAFKREAKSTTLDPLLKEFLEDQAERAVFAEFTRELIDGFDKQMAEAGLAQDVGGAAAFAVTILAAVLTEKELADSAMLELAKSFQASLDRPVNMITVQDRSDWYSTKPKR